MESKNQSIKELLAEILDVIAAELGAANPVDDTNTNGQNTISRFSSVQIIQDAETIPKEEVDLLTKAALSRENALTLLRKNNIIEGKMALEKGNRILEDISLSNEGFLISSTYQSAAESFLHLQNKNFTQALHLMQDALETHKELFLEYGHPIEVRRIHLGRNIAKVLCLSDKTVEAFKLSAQLIQYVILDNSSWPLDYGKLENPDIISLNMKMFTINQLTKEIDYILSQNVSKEVILHFEELIATLEQSSLEESKILLSWCKAYHSIIQNDKIAFLENALIFFKNHQGLLPHANHYMLTTLSKTFLN